MGRYDGYALMPESTIDGFTYGAITPVEGAGETGAGFLEGPDGSRAGLQWELSDTPFIMRIEGPDANGWGIYRVGFTRTVSSVDDLVYNLGQVLPKLKILYTRSRPTLH